MKKSLLSTLSCALLFMLAINTMAQETADVLKAPAGAITIDGDLTEWGNVEEIYFLGFWGDNEPEGNSSDLDGIFKLLWTDDGIYIMVDIIDDDITPKAEGWADWDADQVELYFEPTGEAEPGTDFVDVSASQIRYSPGTTDVNAEPLVLTGKNLAEVGDDWGSFETEDSKIGEVFEDGVGYKAEIFIHFNDINPDGVENVSETWGFTITVSDADDGEKRNCTMLWELGEDGQPAHSQDAGSFGRINLLNEEFIKTSKSDLASVEGLKVYPNPAKTHLYTNSDTKDARIYNLAGSQIMNIENHNGPIDISELKAGAYFIEIDNNYSKFIKN